MNSTIYKLLGYLQIFIGMGSISGAIPMLTIPAGTANGLSGELLNETPFSSYLIPGLVLFIVNGVGSLVASYFSLKLLKPAGILAILFGLFWLIWMAVQVYFMGFINYLQPIFLVTGIIETTLGIILYCKNRG